MSSIIFWVKHILVINFAAIRIVVVFSQLMV